MKKAVKVVQKIDHALGIAAVSLTVILTVIMLVLALTEVVRRYLFDLSFPWSEELLRYLLVWMVFMGAAAAYQRNNMINVDLLLSKMPPKAKSIFNLIVHIVSFAFLVAVTVLAFQRVTSPTIVKRISTTLKVSMAYAYAAPVAGLTLMAFSSLAKIPLQIETIKKLFSESNTNGGNDK